jgi:hypothetical protein
MGWPGPLTHRQYLVWQRWLQDEWNRPSRADYHVMRVAQVVASVAPGAPQQGYELLKFGVEFPPAPVGGEDDGGYGDPNGPDVDLTPEQAEAYTEMALGIWEARLGVKILRADPPPPSPQDCVG